MLKKLTKTSEFLCSCFNIEDRRKKQYFLQITHYFFKKGKFATEMHEKTCVVYGGGAVLTEHGKGGL